MTRTHRALAHRSAATASRPAAPRCRAGASSLLRLARPDTERAGDWLGRARQLGGLEAAAGRAAARPATQRAAGLTR